MRAFLLSIWLLLAAVGVEVRFLPQITAAAVALAVIATLSAVKPLVVAGQQSH